MLRFLGGVRLILRSVLSLDTILRLAPDVLETTRGSRYRADEQATDLASFHPDDRRVLVFLYALLDELETVVRPSSPGTPQSSEPLAAFLARHDLSDVIAQVRTLGTHDERLAATIHDVRGGALTTLFVQLARSRRAPIRADIVHAIHLGARDHMKMMRNVVRDLDAPARERDLSPIPHSLGDLVNAMREFTGMVGDERVVVTVDARAEGTIAESCVEVSAIDRVVYNLLNNAVRYTNHPEVNAWVVPLVGDLRVVVANRVSEEQRARLHEALTRDPSAIFGAFTTSGSGHGLRIVSDLVGRAYGISGAESLTRGGHVGARLLDDAFLTWFHWPLSGA